WHAKVWIDWLQMDIHSWIGFFACGIDTYAGLGRLLQKVFENAPENYFDVVRSAFISSMTATTTLFITSLIAATFTSWTPAYWATWFLYLGLGFLMLWGFYNLMDIYTAKAALFGIGATLLSLLIGAYSANTLVKSIPYVIQAEVPGANPIDLAVKSLINPLVNNFLGVTSAACQLVFKNPLMIPFTIATLTLAVLAIYLGWIK
ncbi:MAG: hypothetical protein QXR42_09505, partial [Candidatus Bathyarchaeia archaeon]